MIREFLNYVSFGIFGTGISLYVIRCIRQYRYRVCKCNPEKRKTVILTGATSGIGKCCAYELAKRNCKIILGCRNLSLANKLVSSIRSQHSSADVELYHLDLTRLDSINKFVNQVKQHNIDVLINNAGIMQDHLKVLPSSQLEEDMTVNYFSQFHLTNKLLGLPTVSNGDTADHTSIPHKLDRVVFVSSSLAKYGKLDITKPDFSAQPYSYRQAYSNSKLAQCLYAKHLARTNHILTLTLFTGGMVHTRLSRHVLSGYSVLVRPLMVMLSWLLCKSPQQTAQCIVHAALSNDYSYSAQSNTHNDLLLTDFRELDWPPEILAQQHLDNALIEKSQELIAKSHKHHV